MTHNPPKPITLTERARRIDLVRQLAKKLRFCGRVEYHHRFSSAGPAQIRFGSKIVDDVMRVFAQAFDWSEDSQHFSPEAIMAHECGHQVFHRHRHLRRWFGSDISESHEEIVASLIGSLLVTSAADNDALRDKALGDALEAGTNPVDVTAMINGLRKFLEFMLC